MKSSMEKDKLTAEYILPKAFDKRVGKTVAEAVANQGPTMKRISPRAQGRAYRIRKRTSHIRIVLKEVE